MSIYLYFACVLVMNAMFFPKGEAFPREMDSIEKRSYKLLCFWIGASAGTDAWCNVNCNHVPPFCPPNDCWCRKIRN